MLRFISCLVLLMTTQKSQPEPATFASIFALTCSDDEKSSVSYQELADQQPPNGYHVLYSIATNLECESHGIPKKEVDGVPLKPENNECFKMKLSVTGTKTTFTLINQVSYGIASRVCEEVAHSESLNCDNSETLKFKLIWSESEMHVLTLCLMDPKTMHRHASLFIISENTELDQYNMDVLVTEIMGRREIPICALAKHATC